MEPERQSPLAGHDIEPESPLPNAAIPAEKIMPATPEELDQEEEQAIKNIEHR